MTLSMRVGRDYAMPAGLSEKSVIDQCEAVSAGERYGWRDCSDGEEAG